MDGLKRVDSRRNDAQEETKDYDQDAAKPDGEQKSLLQTAQFRFVKQKKLLFQMCSQFQSQFNICANIAFVQGFYHISFYAKYWFLNNTQMPLKARISQSTFSFPTLDLPFQSLDFDFETAKNFGTTEERSGGKGDHNKKIDDNKQEEKTLQRKDSQETFKTLETFTVKDGNEIISESGEGINYKRLKENKIWGCSGETD